MDEYLIFEAFQRGDYIPYLHIKKIANYIAGPLISWSPNRSYYEATSRLKTERRTQFCCYSKKRRKYLQ